MRVAICYYGLSSNIGRIQNSNAYNLPVNYLSNYENHKQVLIKPNNADVFMHTWYHDSVDDVLVKYEPKKYVIEPQIDFYEKASNINNDPTVFGYHQRHHILSRWYSNMRSIRLKEQYEIENNFKYDIVMVTRFDCFYSGEWNLLTLDPSYFYIIGGWGADYNKEFPDVWFISNTENIDVLGNMYNTLNAVYYENRYDNVANYWGGHLLIRRYLGMVNLLGKIRHYKDHRIDNDIKRG